MEDILFGFVAGFVIVVLGLCMGLALIEVWWLMGEPWWNLGEKL